MYRTITKHAMLKLHTGKNIILPSPILRVFISTLTLLFIVFHSPLEAQRRLDLSGYELVWGDEFDDYPTNQQDQWTKLFDTPSSKWINGYIYNGSTATLYPKTWNFSKNEFEYNAVSRQMVSIKKDPVTNNGYLTLRAKSFANGVPNYVDPVGDIRQYTDATVNHNIRSVVDYYGDTIDGLASAITANYGFDYNCPYDPNNPQSTFYTFGFNYGVFEIRAKLPRRMHDYAAFWLWNSEWQFGDVTDFSGYSHDDFHCNYLNRCSSGTNPHNYCGSLEIDQFEFHVDQQNAFPNLVAPGVFFSTIQANWQNLTPCSACTTNYSFENSDPTNTYHTYTVAWIPGLNGDDPYTIWYIDGIEIKTQLKGTPKFLEALVLSFVTLGNNYQAEDGEFSIDYVRVYRPRNSSYPAIGNYLHGLPDSLFPNGYSYYKPVNSTNYNWTSYSDPNRTAYLNSYLPVPPLYQNIHNYEFANYSPDDPVLPNSTGSIIDRIAYGEVVDLPYGEKLLYYTSPDNNNLTSINYLPTPANSTSGIQPPTYFGKYIDATDVDAGSKIDVDSQTGSVFYKSTANELKLYYWTPSGYQIGRVNTTGDPDDVDREITASKPFGIRVPPNNYNSDFRVYYVNSQNELIYYEWQASSSYWQRFPTSIINVKQDLVVAEKTGQLFYEGLDGAVWATTDWFTPGAFSVTPITDIHKVKYYESGNMLSQHLAVEPDGSQVYFVADRVGQYFDPPSEAVTKNPNGLATNWTTNNVFNYPSHFIHASIGEICRLILRTGSTMTMPVYDYYTTGVDDVQGPLKLLQNQSGRSELFYVNLFFKVKTYYQRNDVLDSKISGQEDWMSSTLEAFSKHISPIVNQHSPILASDKFLAVSHDNTTRLLGSSTYNDIAPLICFQQNDLRFNTFRLKQIFDVPTATGLECTGNVLPTDPSRTQHLQFRMAPPHSVNPSFSVFPNPGQGIFKVNIPQNEEGGRLKLYNLLGRLEKEFITDMNNIQEIDCTGLPKGVHILTLETANGISTQKLIIE